MHVGARNAPTFRSRTVMMAENGEPLSSIRAALAVRETRLPEHGNPMNSIIRHLAFQLTCTVACAAALPHSAPAQSAAPPSTWGCSAAEYHLLDFWIGDWDTFDSDAPNGPSVARARVTPIALGCALHELYEQEDGLIGDSILSYDPVRKAWQQTWVTNRGSIMMIFGNFKEGALVLEGDVHLMDGRTVVQRITWKDEGNGVRESAVLSKDGGKTWSPAFNVLFRKRADHG
jgi:hypothetical protein